MGLSPTKLKELLALAKSAKLRRSIEAKQEEVKNSVKPIILPPKSKLDSILDSVLKGNSTSDSPLTNQYGDTITLNAKQQEFVDLVVSGKSCCLIGAAGTGKTTATKAGIYGLEQKGVGLLSSDGHKHLFATGSPAIAGIAFTRTAVNNLKRAMPSNMINNCMTYHALLEYQPFFEEVIDSNGDAKTIKTFEPKRGRGYPIDPSLKVLIIDEASMPSVELHKLLLYALDHRVQFIFLGDINQLPPVFGSAILGYAMLALPTIELTEVYRNAGAIVHLAHRILSGVPLPAKAFPDYETKDSVRIQPWKKSLDKESAVGLASQLVISRIEDGSYNPLTDMVLCPFNVSFGVDEINAHLAGFISKKSNKPTYEIITGFSIKYLAVGDRVMHNKQAGVVTAINPSLGYSGRRPQEASLNLNRWGILEVSRSRSKDKSKSLETNYDTAPRDFDADLDSMLDTFANYTEIEEAKRSASHTVTVLLDSLGDLEPKEVKLTSAGDVNSLALGYAMTVHKSQGSEWRKVMLLLHHSHNSMVKRELLYTAITRAKDHIHIICEKDTLVKGILRQAIQGDTLEEKAEWFKGKSVSDPKQLEDLRWN